MSSYKNIISIKKVGPILLIVMIAISCKKYLPQDRDTVGADSQFTKTVYEPVLGRTTLFSENFYQGSTSYPADFRIVNLKKRNGENADELTQNFPVLVWKKDYTGEEQSIAEIEAKRETQNRPLLEMYPHSGQIVMWGASRSSFIRTQPDSGYVFDIEVSNSGGRRFYRNMLLKPFKERPYEPSNFDPVTGQPLSNGVFASEIKIKGEAKGRYLSFYDVDVFIRKRFDVPTPGNSLRFMFLDTMYKPMNPALFSSTDWDHVVHGFNRVTTDTSVVYEVAYPIPLAPVATRYTVPGNPNLAHVEFTFPRLGFGGMGDNGKLALNFAIYEPGDWEIVFAFKTDNPKFTND